MAVIFDSTNGNDTDLIHKKKPEPKEEIKFTGRFLSKFTPSFAKLIEAYKEYYISERRKADLAPIHVDEIASKVALFYERIRKIVDWKEEHLVRRGAIERTLKRVMISKIGGIISLTTEFDPKKVAEPLILELIRGGHFENDKIPFAQIEKVERILAKYAYILENNPLNELGNSDLKIKRRINLYTWIIEIASCEIEETLDPPIRQKALTNFMVESMLERVKVVPSDIISEDEKNLQVFIAVLRTLFHLDDPIVTYHLIKEKYPGWYDANDAFVREAAENIFLIEKEVNDSMYHPLGGLFYNLCEKYDTIYLLLGDVLDKYSKRPRSIAKSLYRPKKLLSKVKTEYEKRLKTLKKRLTRAAIYSTLSVFVSGIVSLYIFEVPIAKLVYGEWKPLAIVVDMLVPTAFMAILIAIVKPPRKSNLDRVLKEVRKVVFPQRQLDVYEIKKPRKRGFILSVIIGFFYLLATFLSLAFVFFVFELGHVPVTSLYIDTLNVAVIVFAALVVRQRAKELTVEEKASFWEFIVDILAVPVAEIGQWLANKWKEYNIASVFFIALVDMPFSTFIGFIDNWRSFLKERKSEIH